MVSEILIFGFRFRPGNAHLFLIKSVGAPDPYFQQAHWVRICLANAAQLQAFIFLLKWFLDLGRMFNC